MSKDAAADLFRAAAEAEGIPYAEWCRRNGILVNERSQRGAVPMSSILGIEDMEFPGQHMSVDGYTVQPLNDIYAITQTRKYRRQKATEIGTVEDETRAALGQIARARRKRTNTI